MVVLNVLCCHASRVLTVDGDGDDGGDDDGVGDMVVIQ